ncbi:hypothetical protein PSTT_10772 [Puccinia striiformis]|uniref:Uncharacterized protein n=1 Tax=Puccinia striiformis TaxID=27350 RepID=A0A2S4V2Z7_9BASI|nr:hypothetical protein PSTT_10772 [Puccinia striiformis]
MSDFPSAYSISFDHAPSNSFNENQDSFTSFGSPQTPPRLRVMLRSLFDGTVPSSLNTGSSPSLSGPNLPSEAFSRYVPASMIADHLHNASSTVSSDGPGFLTLQIDPRLFGSFNDYAQLSASSDRSPAPADIDQLDNGRRKKNTYTSLSFFSSRSQPRTCPFCPFDHISSGNEAAVEMSSSVANDRLDGTSIASYGKLLPFFFFFFSFASCQYSFLLPLLFLLSRKHHDPLSSVPEDASDFSYVPPRRFRSARHQPSARSSGLNQVKPSPVCHRMRDARGRFISSRTKKPAAIPKTRSLSPLGSAQSPPCLPDPDAVRRIEMETATNTFLNTVLCSKEEPYRFDFDTPNPFHSEFNAAPLFAAAPPSPKSLPGDLNSPFLPDPQVKFRESYLGLYKAILPFISDLSFHCNKEKVYELSKILYATQERFNESSYLYPNVAQAGIPTTSDHVWMG